jgi:P-type Cu+ transporter
VASNSVKLAQVKRRQRGIATALALSVATVDMKQKLGFASIDIALGVPLAAGAVFPLTG